MERTRFLTRRECFLLLWGKISWMILSAQIFIKERSPSFLLITPPFFLAAGKKTPYFFLISPPGWGGPHSSSIYPIFYQKPLLERAASRSIFIIKPPPPLGVIILGGCFPHIRPLLGKKSFSAKKFFHAKGFFFQTPLWENHPKRFALFVRSPNFSGNFEGPPTKGANLAQKTPLRPLGFFPKTLLVFRMGG